MRRLAADIIWIQTMQYYGTREKGSKREFHKDRSKDDSLKTVYKDLKSYWQQIIRFDPLFVNAYLIGPTTLGWNLKRYDEAMEIIDEGIYTVEDMLGRSIVLNIKETDGKHPLITGSRPYLEELKWKLYTLKSIILFFNQDKFTEAIPLLEKIAFRKETPEEIKIILAQVYEQTGDYKKSASLWLHIYDSTVKQSRMDSAQENILRLKKFISLD
ncbi:hypothetical protein ACFLUV_00090 [Elusimicrobiota bacterium]